jgi:hypothetical protein
MIVPARASPPGAASILLIWIIVVKMLSAMPTSKPTRWFVGFFVRGIPPHFRVHSPKKLRMARIGQPAMLGLGQLRGKYPIFEDFCSSAGPDGVVLVAVRVSARNESRAVKRAWGLLGHVRDGLAFVLDIPAKVAPIVLSCPEGRMNARVRRFVPVSWIPWKSKKVKPVQIWEDRCNRLMTIMLKFFDASLSDRWRNHNALTKQIIHSARLYRLGCESESYGMEFLCKFAAMEGLVTGAATKAARRKKGNKLLERVPQLGLRVRWSVRHTIKKLWKMRNLAAHEARIEYFPKYKESYPLEVLIPRLEFIAVAVFVFACENIRRAESVSALWRLADKYKLPTWACWERPKGIGRLPGRRILISRSEIWTNAGKWFEVVFQQEMRRTKAECERGQPDGLPLPAR